VERAVQRSGAEIGLVRAQIERRPLEEIEPVAGTREVSAIRELVRRVQVHEEILGYGVELAEATRRPGDTGLSL
jgi:hypothetical protein